MQLHLVGRMSVDSSTDDEAFEAFLDQTWPKRAPARSLGVTRFVDAAVPHEPPRTSQLVFDSSTDDEAFAAYVNRRKSSVNGAHEGGRVPRRVYRRRVSTGSSSRTRSGPARPDSRSPSGPSDRAAIASLMDRGTWRTCVPAVTREKERRWSEWKESWSAMSRKAQDAYMRRPFFSSGPFTDEHIDTITDAVLGLHTVGANENASLWTNFAVAVLIPHMLKCIVGLYRLDMSDDEYDAYMRSF